MAAGTDFAASTDLAKWVEIARMAIGLWRAELRTIEPRGDLLRHLILLTETQIFFAEQADADSSEP